MNKIFIYILVVLIGVLCFNCKGTRSAAKESHDVKKGEDIVMYSKPLDSLKTDYFDIDSIAQIKNIKIHTYLN